MQYAFRKAGLEGVLRTVINGQQAMEYLLGQGRFADRTLHPVPAVVLLDLNLPGVSGFDMLRWMKARPELAAVPVVVFSSSSRGEDKAKALDLGVKEYVEKPQSIGSFVDLARRLKEKWLS